MRGAEPPLPHAFPRLGSCYGYTFTWLVRLKITVTRAGYHNDSMCA
jgi:hypothetical protein